jgi:hypothetical protein
LQLLPDLGFGHRLVTRNEHDAPGLRRRDQDAGRCNECGSTDQCHNKSTIHGFLRNAAHIDRCREALGIFGI